MSAPQSPPSPPSPVLRVRTVPQPFWWLLGFVGAIGVVALAYRWGLPLPQCGWRQLTGLPCPFCGSTRALLAWSQLDLKQAFTLNPMTFVASLAVIGTAVLWTVDRLFAGARALPWLQARLSRRALLWTVATVVLGNWLYLLLASPR